MPYISHAALLPRPGAGGIQAPVDSPLRRPGFQSVVPSVSTAAVVAPKVALRRPSRGGAPTGQMHVGSPSDPVVVPAVTTASTRPIRALSETFNKATRALAAALEEEKNSFYAENDDYISPKCARKSISRAEALEWLLDPAILQATATCNGTVVQDGTGDLQPVVKQSELLAVPRHWPGRSPPRGAGPGRQQEELSAARDRSSRHGAVGQTNCEDVWFTRSWGDSLRDSSEDSADLFDSDGPEQDPDSPCGHRRRSLKDVLEPERGRRGGSSSSSGIAADGVSSRGGSSSLPSSTSSLASLPSPTPSPTLSPTPAVRVVRVADARVPLVTKDLSFDDNRPIGVDAAIPAFLRRARAAPPGPVPGHAPGHAPSDED